jgi:hypothetical protein
VPEGRDGADGAEKSGKPLHVFERARAERVALDLHGEQAISGESRRAARPLDVLHEVGVHLPLVADDDGFEEETGRVAEDLPPEDARLFEPRWTEGDDVYAGARERIRGAPHRRPDIRMHHRPPIVFEVPHP